MVGIITIIFLSMVKEKLGIEYSLISIESCPRIVSANLITRRLFNKRRDGMISIECVT